MKRISSLLVLVLIYGAIYVEGLSPVVKIEREKKTVSIYKLAIEHLFFVLGSHQYKDFSTSSGLLTVTLLQLYMHNPVRTNGSITVSYTETPGMITVNAENKTNSAFCFEFDTIAVQNWLIFSTSSYAVFRVCANPCKMSYNLDSDVKLTCKYTVDNVKLDSAIGKLFGLQNSLKKALESNSWEAYIEGVVSKLMKEIITPYVHEFYKSFEFSINYPDKSLHYPYNHTNMSIGTKAVTLNYAYGGKQEKKAMSNIDDSEADAEYRFDKDLFLDILKKGVKLDWSGTINDAQIPFECSVRLNSTYFRQVVPDLPDDLLNKVLQAKLKCNQSKASVVYSGDYPQILINDMDFNMDILMDKDGKGKNFTKFLTGKFVMNLVLEVEMRGKGSISRLIAAIKRRSFRVTELTNNDGYETIRGGMEKIITSIFDEYLMKVAGDSAIQSGIPLTKFGENVNQTKSSVRFENGKFIAKVYFV